MTAGFFYSKTFKIIATVIISVELIIIITLKVVDLYCDEPGRNSTSNSYSSKSQRSYSSGKKSTVMNRDAGTKKIGEQTIAWSILTVFMKRR